MFELILVCLGIYWLATDSATALPVLGVVVVLFIIGAMVDGKNKSRPANAERPRTRIDHPHIMTPDTYECSICGTRFNRNEMTCPYCGVRFNGTRKDYEAFDEELDELEAWEEEEGC